MHAHRRHAPLTCHHTRPFFSPVPRFSPVKPSTTFSSTLTITIRAAYDPYLKYLAETNGSGNLGLSQVGGRHAQHHATQPVSVTRLIPPPLAVHIHPPKAMHHPVTHPVCLPFLPVARRRHAHKRVCIRTATQPTACSTTPLPPPPPQRSKTLIGFTCIIVGACFLLCWGLVCFYGCKMCCGRPRERPPGTFNGFAYDVYSKYGNRFGSGPPPQQGGYGGQPAGYPGSQPYGYPQVRWRGARCAVCGAVQLPVGGAGFGKLCGPSVVL
jgi:hypothetical protein